MAGISALGSSATGTGSELKTGVAIGSSSTNSLAWTAGVANGLVPCRLTEYEGVQGRSASPLGAAADSSSAAW